VTAVRNRKSDNSIISIFTCSYDEAGNRTQVEEANGDLVTWSYDDGYQLTRERSSGANAYDLTYSYGEVGNRLTRLEDGVTASYSYDEGNELTMHNGDPAAARSRMRGREEEVQPCVTTYPDWGGSCRGYVCMRRSRWDGRHTRSSATPGV